MLHEQLRYPLKHEYCQYLAFSGHSAVPTLRQTCELQLLQISSTLCSFSSLLAQFGCLLSFRQDEQYPNTPK